MPCPTCGSFAYHKSHSRNRWEKLLRRIFPVQIYRCDVCGRRYRHVELPLWMKRRTVGMVWFGVTLLFVCMALVLLFYTIEQRGQVRNMLTPPPVAPKPSRK